MNPDVATALQRVTATLATQGFGMLADIDDAATMTKKIGVDMPPQEILGACNPHLACRAIAAQREIGALLPSNVVVRSDAACAVGVECMHPDAVLKLVNHPMSPRCLATCTGVSSR